jgi:hypothetical protein
MEKTKGLGLFLGLPTYCGQRFNMMPIIHAITGQQSFQQIIPMESDISLLAMSFNRLWCEALKARQKNHITHFLLMHADICPMPTTPIWLDVLYQEMVAMKAEVMSVVSPIKDTRGVTSTGLDGDDLWSPRRLTMKEVEAQEGSSFTHPNLIVNTGLLMVDMRRDWVKNICFTIKDTIRWKPDGTPYPCVQPEDWDFSRQARAFGIKLWATKAVKITHQGGFKYPNFGKWGEYEVDLGDGNQVVKK